MASTSERLSRFAGSLHNFPTTEGYRGGFANLPARDLRRARGRAGSGGVGRLGVVDGDLEPTAGDRDHLGTAGQNPCANQD